ncbi:MAG TPA: flagellar hook-associated protein FlgL [Steroidobacteraceae bacterium]|nr:flagellar hook-associated protein FlgL [Steroidobacteraceae bacterium]
MRVTDSLIQSQFLAAVSSLESNLAQTQNEISSSSSFTTAAGNPAAAGAVNNYTQALAQSQQYVTNSNAAQTRLSTEDNSLSQVQSALQSLRDLALEANNSGLSDQDRSAIATQATQIQNTLLGLANTQDGNGEYLFGGFSTGTQPFSLTSTGATYNGDQGQRMVQIGPGQTIPDSDNGNAVFQQIKTGNGTFNVTEPTGAPANTGTGVVGATSVSNPETYAAGNGQYTIDFTAPGTYEVRDSTNAVIDTGAYASGGTISFAGIQVNLTGAPAAGDSFSVAPSTNQSLFATVQNFVSALQPGSDSAASLAQMNNGINGTLNNIDQALDQMSNVRADIGGRLNSITTQQSVAGTQQTQLQSNISSLQGLDYAAAITTLDQQNTTLSAALQAYAQTQGLSLFNFIK